MDTKNYEVTTTDGELVLLMMPVIPIPPLVYKCIVCLLIYSLTFFYKLIDLLILIKSPPLRHCDVFWIEMFAKYPAMLADTNVVGRVNVSYGCKCIF